MYKTSHQSGKRHIRVVVKCKYLV